MRLFCSNPSHRSLTGHSCIHFCIRDILGVVHYIWGPQLQLVALLFPSKAKMVPCFLPTTIFGLKSARGIRKHQFVDDALTAFPLAGTTAGEIPASVLHAPFSGSRASNDRVCLAGVHARLCPIPGGWQGLGYQIESVAPGGPGTMQPFTLHAQRKH